MSIMENIRGPRGDGEESGGKYNPFRILEIGESMIRYCDGIRIKNYNFLAILTSDRLVLIESAQQSAGTIAKEIPVSMIQGAVMERDEKNRPGLSVSMEVGGQTRLMKLVFTGLISEPETECREWFTAINGYPPEPIEPEPEPVPVAPQVPVPPEPSPVAVAGIPAAAIVESQKREIPQEPIVQTPGPVPVVEPEPIRVSPDLTPQTPVSPAPSAPVVTPVIPKTIPVIEREIPGVDKQRISVPTPSENSIQIFIEKPVITPIKIGRKIIAPVGSASGKARYCVHCGSKIPAHARFCQVCGKTQV